MTTTQNSVLNRYKKVFVNFSFRISTNVISKLLALITLPVISRAFGPEVFGRWNLLLTILGYVAIPFTVGIVNYGVREVAKGNISEVGKIFSSRLLLCVISYCISIVIFGFLNQFDGQFFMALVFGIIYLLSLAANMEYYYIGTGNFKAPAIAQLIGQIFYVLFVVFFIKNRDDFIYLILIYSLYNLITSGYLLLNFPERKELNLKLSFKNAFGILFQSYKLGVSGLIENFSISLPVIAIATLIGNYETGIFSAAFKLIAICLLGFHIILTVVAPDLVKLKRRGKNEITSRLKVVTFIFIFLGIISAAFSYFLGEQIIHFVYGDKFKESVPLLKLFAVIYLPMLPLGMLFNSVLIYFEKDKEYLYTMVISSVLLVVLLPVLINKFAEVGAVYAMSIYMISYMSFGFFYLIKELRLMND